MAQQSDIQISNFLGGVAEVTVNGKSVGELWRSRSEYRVMCKVNPMRSYFIHCDAKGRKVGSSVFLGEGITAREARANCIAYLRSL